MQPWRGLGGGGRMDPTRWRLYAEAFRLWVPILVSLCAISLTIFQAMATRHHQRLSVQPRLDWNIEAGREGDIAYSLVNNGVGPAVLKSLILTVDGKPVGPDGPATCAAVDAAIGRGLPDWDTGCFDMVEDFVIRAGTSVVVYASRRATGLPAEPLRVPPEEYLRLGVVGRYCSFYEDCWELD